MPKKNRWQKETTHTHTKKTRVAIWFKKTSAFRSPILILTEILGEFLFCFETGQIWDRINGQSLREPALVGWLNFPWETRPVLTSVFRRLQGYRWWLGELEKNEGGIEKFAEGYKIFGWNRDNEKGWDDGIGWGHGVGLDILG